MTKTKQSEVEQIISDYIDLWNGDYSKLEIVSDECGVYDSDAPDGEVHGRDGFEAFVRGFHEQFPEANFRITEVLADDGIVLCEWSLTGINEGEARGMSKLVIEEGKIAEDWIYHDR